MVREATLDWLHWQDMQHKPEIEQTNYLYELEGQGKKKPEPPESYLIYRRLQLFQMTMFSGGYYNQPHILLMEFEAVMAAEAEINRIRAFNRRNKGK